MRRLTSGFDFFFLITKCCIFCVFLWVLSILEFKTEKKHFSESKGLER